jgi:hypothetical protein
MKTPIFKYGGKYQCPVCHNVLKQTNNKYDYLYFICSNCNELLYLSPTIHKYYDKDRNDKKIRLYKDDIDTLIDIALLLRDKDWFDNLLTLKESMTDEWITILVNDKQQE